VLAAANARGLSRQGRRRSHPDCNSDSVCVGSAVSARRRTGPRWRCCRTRGGSMVARPVGRFRPRRWLGRGWCVVPRRWPPRRRTSSASVATSMRLSHFTGGDGVPMRHDESEEGSVVRAEGPRRSSRRRCECRRRDRSRARAARLGRCSGRSGRCQAGSASAVGPMIGALEPDVDAIRLRRHPLQNVVQGGAGSAGGRDGIATSGFARGQRPHLVPASSAGHRW
jgi:hypothetical protein